LSLRTDRAFAHLASVGAVCFRAVAGRSPSC